jgi:HSP20 family protein
MNIIKFHRPSLPLPLPGFARFTDLQDELDRLFGAPFSGAARETAWTPALDVYEDKENFVVKAELPGLKREEIEVSFQDDTLTISGERKAETKSEDTEVYRAERFVGRFQRAVALPSTVAADKVNASYKDGVLTITLPKSEAAKPKKIDIAAN